MHHRIEKIDVKGFWGAHNFVVPIFPDVTFFIGVNGTGKTTLINLVAAVLVCDFETIDKIPFSRIEILLDPISGNKKPSIIVTKKSTKQSPFPQIEYEIKDSQSSDVQRFSLDEFQEQVLLRSRHLPQRRVMRDFYKHHAPNVLEKVKELVQVSWLSIHRSPPIASQEDRGFESSVDRKIEQLNNELVRYFSSLSKLRDDEVKKFQEFIFLSLIDERPVDKPFTLTIDQSASSKAELEQIFQELHVSEAEFGPRIDNFFARTTAIASNDEKERQVTPVDLAFIFGLSRIDSVVRLWRDLQGRSKQIFAQRDKFIDTLNDMLQRKRAEIGESNEVLFRTVEGQALTPQMLSSGEKQLYILLGEVLLQKNQPFVFVADEPELSLHVTWQERLIRGLRNLNGSAQILAATHSPDIVGGLGKHTIDMETLIQ